MGCSEVRASDLIFAQGFGNISAAIIYPADGTTIGTGVPPVFSGSASVPATLVWTGTYGYIGTGEEVIVTQGFGLGFQQIFLRATTADSESALAEADVTGVIAP